MSLQQDTDNSPFGPGADLWIVPERQNSNLVQKLDWYLNFQISKSAQHQPPSLAPEVMDILKNCALEGYDWAPQESSALLILASPFVPARWVMVLKDSDRLDAWAKTAVEKWKKMNSPSVRIFLPHNIPASQFESFWKKAGGDTSAMIVVDSKDAKHG